MKKLIVTGDDFGLSIPVNEAIAKAHEKGILTTTSLMVSAPEVKDAVTRAKSLPDLKVGLHIVLSNGIATLPASELPALVHPNGEFDNNMIRSGVIMFFDATAKRQLRKEIEAQFAAFAETGLKLDHVNAHKHFHLHPTIFDTIIEIGKNHGLTAIRIPNEPSLDSIIDNRKQKFQRKLQALFLKPFIARMKEQCDKHGIKYNDTIYGLYDSGHMTLDKLVRILPHIESGLTEIYCHPATERWDGIDPEANDYEFEAEFKALSHPRVLRTIEKFDIQLTGFNS